MRFFCLNSNIWFSDTIRNEFGEPEEWETKLTIETSMRLKAELDAAIRKAQQEDSADKDG